MNSIGIASVILITKYRKDENIYVVFFTEQHVSRGILASFTLMVMVQGQSATLTRFLKSLLEGCVVVS